jgi:hypothetical protein
MVLALLVALAVTMRRLAAQKPAGDVRPPVQILGAADGRPPVSSTDRGATYHWLEGQAVRVTTRFNDAIAVAERDASGDLKTRLTDGAGNELATFRVDRVDGTRDVLDYRSADRGTVRAAGLSSVRPTLDWGNRQVYGLWKDLKARPNAPLEWDGDVMQPRGMQARDRSRDIVEVRTDWPGGIAASVARTAGPRRHALTGTRIQGTQFVSRLSRDNVELGVSRWFVEEQVLEWSFPGLTEGHIDAERLKKINGWPFTPDVAWTNVQSFAFQHFHRLVAEKGFVAQQRGWLDRAVSFWSPTLSANEVGCDGFHWLDGSVFRPCCDVHDRCYERFGCSASSWWQWWNSWTCDLCNGVGAFCFVSRTQPFYRSIF